MSRAARLGPCLLVLTALLLALVPGWADGALLQDGGEVGEVPSPTTVGRAPGGDWPPAPAVTATAYVLFDQETGQVLAERAADRPRPIASTVKILTALTVLEHAELDDVVTAGEEVQGVGGASVGLQPGDSWTVAQLLDALIVRSGNEAALALAVHVGGSVEGFLTLMATHARQLGLEDAVLRSPNGLDDTNVMSARELAVITRAAMHDERFRLVAGKRSVSLPGRGTEPSRNEMLERYRGATGVKTGFTEAAGWSLVASARRDGRELVAVLLDSRSAAGRFEDAAALLDHGFEGFRREVAAVDLRLRRAAEWVVLRADRRPLLVPAEDPVLTIDRLLPVEPPSSSLEVGVSWHDQPLASLVVDPQPAGRAPASGAAALGRFLVDRTYAAMRAATRDEAWRP